MLNIGVLVSGSGSNLQALMDKIEDGYIDGKIRVVISDRSGAYGIDRAIAASIPALVLDRKTMNRDDLNTKLYDALKCYDVDLVVLAGYLSILSEDIIEGYRNAIINIHPSLIPSFCGPGYYGLKVHKSVIEYGAKVSGCTVHFVDEGTDTGPIILQKAVEVMEDDTPENLQKRILEYEHKLLPEAVRLICLGKVQIDGRMVKLIGGSQDDY